MALIAMDIDYVVDLLEVEHGRRDLYILEFESKYRCNLG